MWSRCTDPKGLCEGEGSHLIQLSIRQHCKGDIRSNNTTHIATIYIHLSLSRVVRLTENTKERDCLFVNFPYYRCTCLSNYPLLGSHALTTLYVGVYINHNLIVVARLMNHSIAPTVSLHIHRHLPLVVHLRPCLNCDSESS